MGRIIKFRVWDGEQMITQSKNKEYDDYYMMTLQGDFYGHTRTGDEYFDFYESELNKKQYTLLQYTGLKDCNGVEIYEGDIVKVDYETSKDQWRSTDVMEFYEGSFGSRNKNGRLRIPALFMGEAIKGMNVNSYKVIGNIYEHPELINQVNTNS